ncbi:charged multivesicular body protein 6-A-like [Patiria miniata]|uniref:Charged multivesicular body protein 6 n=1 Tax=Patiria miniata TaxID=46514 RepID=A0A914ALK2_PATMI|nr:charged multivesicular body protein 6-A-like [Patiria miniata]XP_038064308.1 charged multivesicular body protein 6-A-like [Patiria miniata]XP_038064309.1 charged multivesicular body protein 6-A-like [Patiria miniata]
MGNLFGKKKSRVTEQDKAVLQLKEQRDKLKQYQRKIEANLMRERQVAKTLLRDGKKEKAKVLLKKKRYQEQVLSKTDNQLSNLEQLVQEIEFAQVEARVIEGLKTGNECLKKMHQMMSFEDVERIMEETQEGIEYQREIDELLAGGLTEDDEAAVLEELAQLTGVEEAGNQLEQLPDVPMDKLPEIEQEERRKERTEEREMVLAS